MVSQDVKFDESLMHHAKRASGEPFYPLLLPFLDSSSEEDDEPVAVALEEVGLSGTSNSEELPRQEVPLAMGPSISLWVRKTLEDSSVAMQTLTDDRRTRSQHANRTLLVDTNDSSDPDSFT